MKNGSRLFQTALSIYSKRCVAAVVSLHGLCSVANNHVSKILLSHVYFVLFSLFVFDGLRLCVGGFSQMYRCVCDWLGMPYREEVQWVSIVYILLCSCTDHIDRFFFI